MTRLFWIVLLLPLAAIAAVNVNISQWELRSISAQIAQYADYDSCEAAARAQPAPAVGTTNTYYCRRTIAVAGVADPPQPPPPPPSGDNGGLMGPFLPYSAQDSIDVAFVNFAKTAMNEVNEPGYNVPLPYSASQGYVDLNQAEPWLYDRPATFFKLYLKTGNAKYQTYGITLFRNYMARINSTGYFTLANGDLKYSYLDSLVLYEALTGDKQYRTKAKAIYDMTVRDWPARYSSTGFWTERHHAYAMGAALGYYALTRDAGALARAKSLFDVLVTMAAASGAPLHTVEQHGEGDGDKRMMTSPWMSAVLVEYVAAYQRASGDARAVQFLSRYADYVVAQCLYDGGIEDSELAGKRMPWYMCGNGVRLEDSRGWGDMEHAIDVAGVLAHGVWAKKQLGQSTTTTLKAYNDLRTTGQYTFGYWTRSTATLPKYRVNPPRKFNWWFGTTYDSSYLVR